MQFLNSQEYDVAVAWVPPKHLAAVRIRLFLPGRRVQANLA